MKTKDNTLIKVAEALLMDYSSIYFVDPRTGNYQWYSFDPVLHALKLRKEGEDFFASMIRDAEKVVYEEDRHIFTEELTRESIVSGLRNGTLQSIEYRLVIDGEPVYHALRLIREEVDNEEVFILGVLNIDKEVQERKRAENLQHERYIYTQITERLAVNYDAIYYVDPDSGVYLSFVSGDIFRDAELKEGGKDFFSDARNNLSLLVHPDDRDWLFDIMDRDYLISALDSTGQYSAEYNLLSHGEPVRTRLTVMWANDRKHFVICVENIEEEYQKGLEHNEALRSAFELARRDNLTGVKNKNAYNDFEQKMQKMIEEGDCDPFAVVVCDLNDLKIINDTRGHKAGDDYIIRACRMICKVFDHSPVFRVGGDEFAVILRKKDYFMRVALLERLRQQAREHMLNQDGPVLASGMAVYNASRHDSIAQVFREADKKMYEDKTFLKTGVLTEEDIYDGAERIMPENRRKRLDDMFEAFEVVAEGAYVFLCDMKFDYSRWSEAAVEDLGVPSAYMYDAGYIWEEHIHPDDRKAYHEAMDGIFFGNSLHHNMQYRAKDASGEYVGCTCQGTVVRDRNGDSEYFCGIIRNHQVREQIDGITGLRNQYGFFEDIQAYLSRKKQVRIMMIGISRFSELNEVYGYQFGNLLLQRVGRYLFERIGDNGNVYRLDGTRFGVISYSGTEEELQAEYEDLRAVFRDGFTQDDHFIILETNAAMVTVDDFNVDDQTIYACLNHAYGESRNLRQGDMVIFKSYQNMHTREEINRIQAIRASITRNCEGYFMTYQPIVDAHSEKLIGAEALLRWENDEYGVVPPNQFIEIIEKDSLYPSLGEWILKTALNEMRGMLVSRPDFIVCVNLSYTQVGRPGFVDSVEAILEETGFPPGNLCLEITERCRLLDMDMLINVAVGLKARGIGIALDDFGTGFSSISLVRDLPLDVIKIDRSFIKDIQTNEVSRELIRIFANTASLYHIKVCVEGVENQDIRRILLESPVNRLQGFYYSRPIRQEKFLQWVRAREDISLLG